MSICFLQIELEDPIWWEGKNARWKWSEYVGQLCQFLQNLYDLTLKVLDMLYSNVFFIKSPILKVSYMKS